MANIIRVLLTLTYVALGECHLDQLARHLLGLPPSVGPLPPRHATLDILHSIYHDTNNRLPFGLKVHNYNSNPNRNNNPNVNKELNPPLGFDSFNPREFNPPTAQEQYPEYTIDDKTPGNDAFLKTEGNVPMTGEISNTENLHNKKVIQETSTSKTNEINGPKNEGRGENLTPSQGFLLVTPNNNGNNAYLLQQNGKTSTSNTINLPMGTNQPMLYGAPNPTQNNQLNEIMNGKLMLMSTAQTNQNSPYYSSQLNLPALNQNPGYVMIYTNPVSYNGQNGYAGQGTNAAGIPVDIQNPGTNTVYIDTNNQGGYAVSAQAPNFITTRDTMIPQIGSQAANGNFASNSDNPNCCRNKIYTEPIEKETNIKNNSAAANKGGNPPENQPLVMTANGLTSQSLQSAVMISHKESSDKNEPKDKSDEHNSDLNKRYKKKQIVFSYTDYLST